MVGFGVVADHVVNGVEIDVSLHVADQQLREGRLHRVDHRGLDAADRRLLTLLMEQHGGGPVGLETLAAALGEDPTTLEAVVEPFLLQQGLLVRTPRGRMLTDAARAHLLEAA